MHLTTIARRRLLAGLTAVAGMIGGSAAAQPPAPPAANAPTATPAEAKIDKQTGALIVPLGGAVRFTPGKRVIADVFIRNQDVVAARFDPASPRTLVLTGLMSGASQIIVTFDDKSKATFDVVVQPDYDLLRNVIRRAVPTATVDVIPGVGNVIILTGYITRPEDSDTIAKIASSAVGGNIRNVINNLQIGGAQHVLIDVTIAQVDRTELRERGTSFGVVGTQVGISSILGGLATRSTTLAGIAATGAGGAFQAPINPAATANLVTGIVPAGTVVALRALRTEGLAKFLSEPKVITQTGRPAFLRAGGQQAVLSPSSGINGPGVVLENVGTQLEVLPIVLGNGKIYLEVNPQFRSVNTGRGITTAFGFTPGFNEQQTRSSVLMESGQTFAIGGLLETQVQNSAEKVPYLGDLPLVGFAFSSVRAEERETELIVLVTPRLVDAMDCAQVPRRVPGKETRSPDDYELFIESLIEAPRGQRTVRSGGCYNPAYKCDPTVAGFPCQGNVCTGVNGVGVAGAGCATGNCAPAPAPVVPGAPPAALPTLPAGGEVPATEPGR
jgi:pilus assembly protein CpaC